VEPCPATKQAAREKVGGGAGGANQHSGESNRWESAVLREEDGDDNIVVVVALPETLAEAVRKRRRILHRQDSALRNRCLVVLDMIRYLYIVMDAARLAMDTAKRSSFGPASDRGDPGHDGTIDGFHARVFRPSSGVASSSFHGERRRGQYVAFLVGQCQGIERSDS
jgi:hypothetical protein